MIQITWLGHATFELIFESGHVLIFDPWIEGNPSFPKDYQIERVDAIAVSHGHSDHTGDLLSLAKKFQPKIVSIFEIHLWLESKGIENSIGINKGGTFDLGFTKLTMTQALHSSAIKDGDTVIYAGEPAGYVLTAKDGRRAYFAGDTAVFGDMSIIHDLYAPELAFLPVGDHFTMGPREAALAARLIGPKRVIPMHYGTFPQLTGTPEQLQQDLQGQNIEVWKLQPGHPVSW